MKRKRNATRDGPHPIDIHVGRKIRMARIREGLSQMQLAEGLGLTFQQVQKYENGKNRISASRLFETGELLGVSPEYFFEGLGKKGKKQRAENQEMTFSPQTLRLMKYADQLDPAILAPVTQLLKSMVED